MEGSCPQDVHPLKGGDQTGRAPQVVFRWVPHHPPPVDCEQPMLIVLGQNLVAVAPSDLTKDHF